MSKTNQIFFDEPGDFSLWEQTCLPIGNGYMGASMFGGIKTERGQRIMIRSYTDELIDKIFNLATQEN